MAGIRISLEAYTPDVLGKSENVLLFCSAAAAAAQDSVFLSAMCCGNELIAYPEL